MRRRPSQERSSVTVDSILGAAAELFCRIGYDRSSTNRIAERAGVSIGSLYQYFANKEAILAALLDHHQRAVHAVVEEAFVELDDPEVPLAAGLENLFRSLVDLHAEDPELTRVLSEEVPHLARGTPETGEVEHYTAMTVAMLDRRREIDLPNPELSAIILVTTIDSLTRWMVHGAPAGLDTEAYICESVQLLQGYLTGGPE
jgi:AcrR family transcriptional regulator